MIFYAIFRGRVQRLISDLEAAVTHILASAFLAVEQSGRNARRF